MHLIVATQVNSQRRILQKRVRTMAESRAAQRFVDDSSRLGVCAQRAAQQELKLRAKDNRGNKT